MLRAIHPLLSPDLLHALRTMGHGDEIVIADANFPASTLGPKVIRADGSVQNHCLRPYRHICRSTISFRRQQSEWRWSTNLIGSPKYANLAVSP